MTRAALVLWAAGVLIPQNASVVSTVVGGERTHVVARGESWTSIGARAGVSPAVLAARNGRTTRAALRAGESIVVDNRHIVPIVPNASIVINVPQRMLFHVVDGRLRAHYPVAVGAAASQTPLGPFTIIERETDPTWDVPTSIQEEMRREGKPVVTRMPPGPDNPLGKYWLRMSFGSFGVHGTNAPLSIYSATTHGCVRMHPDDIAELYPLTAEGDIGRTIYEPVLAAVTAEGRVYLEVNRDIYRRVPNMYDLAIEAIARAGAVSLVDLERVRDVVRASEGIAVDVTSAHTTPRVQ